MKISTEKAKDKILKWIKKNMAIVLLLAVGLVFLLLPGKSDKTQQSATGDESLENVYSLEETEEKLSGLLSGIKGAGKVKVMLTLKTGVERVVAKDEKQTESSSNDETGSETEKESEGTVVIISSSGDEQPVTLKYIYPEYLGALVVAEGANSSSVKLAIIEAVTSVTGLPIGKITVLSMEK